MYTEHGQIGDIYSTDITAYMENIECLEEMPHEYVVIAPSYMVYKADYSEFLDAHIDRVIHHRDVRAGFDMSVEKFAVISFVNHITRSYDNVFMRHLLEALYVFHISGNVGTVNVADLTVFCIHDIQTAAF